MPSSPFLHKTDTIPNALFLDRASLCSPSWLGTQKGLAVSISARITGVGQCFLSSANNEESKGFIGWDLIMLE